MKKKDRQAVMACIRAARERLGMTHAQCAEAAGWTAGQVWTMYESGKKPNVTPEVLQRMGAVVGLDIEHATRETWSVTTAK